MKTDKKGKFAAKVFIILSLLCLISMIVVGICRIWNTDVYTDVQLIKGLKTSAMLFGVFVVSLLVSYFFIDDLNKD